MNRALMRNNKSTLSGLSKATVYVNWLTLHPQFHTPLCAIPYKPGRMHPYNNHNRFMSTHTKTGASHKMVSATMQTEGTWLSKAQLLTNSKHE